jgi:hypothetical protein
MPFSGLLYDEMPGLPGCVETKRLWITGPLLRCFKRAVNEG